MNNISDKLVLTIILITILFVFGLIFSVKSPERKVIDSPIMWKDDYSNISIFKSNNINSKRIKILFTKIKRSYSSIYKNFFRFSINLSFHF